jgi:hypothetical protein
LLRVYGPPPGPPEGRYRRNDGQAHRLSFASETSLKEENEFNENGQF